jgi:Rho GTPase-activating protein RGD1
MGHLHRYRAILFGLTFPLSKGSDRISQHESENQMSISNLSIVFGPTLLNPPSQGGMAMTSNGPGGQTVNGQTANGGANTSQIGDNAHWQNRAVETILEHYVDIFVDESES